MGVYPALPGEAGALAWYVFIVRRGGEMICKAAMSFSVIGMNGLWTSALRGSVDKARDRRVRLTWLVFG